MATIPRRSRTTRLAGIALATALVASCGGDDSGSTDAGGTDTETSAAGETGGESGGESGSATGESISVMIAASGPAETAAVQAAVDAWEAESGNTVELIPAEDINLQLGQALAGGDPPDVFYVNADKFQEYASGGSLANIGSQLTDPDDFYPSLRDVFTYEGDMYCAPKDFSTLGLVINTDMWAAAGLTDADIPQTWDDLATVAQTLTTGDVVGLATGATRDRVGAFMVAGGGYFVSSDQTEVTADTPENLSTLEYIQGLLEAGSYSFTENMDMGWGGEAFGKQAAAMVIEGNWIRGAMNNDFPDVNYTVAEIPAGPSGDRGSMVFTQCWGVAAASDQQDAAVSFVDFMVQPETQLELAAAFGVMPSRESARDAYLEATPENEPFLNAAEYGRGQVTLAEFTTVLTEFDKQLLDMANGGTDPASILEDLQANGEDVLGG
jgi:multiple sugar transport system substrate-binding protein